MKQRLLTILELYRYVSDNELFSISIDDAARWYGMTEAHYHALKRQRAAENRRHKRLRKIAPKST